MDPFASPYDPQPLRDWMKDQPITTIPSLFQSALTRCQSQPFLGHKAEGAYQYQTYGEVAHLVERAAGSLLHLNVKTQDRIAQISSNRPQWVITDLATMSVGAIHVPLYSTISVDTLSYILNDSSAKLIVAETKEHLAHLKQCQKELPSLEGIITHASFNASDFQIPIWNWDEFLALGDGQSTTHMEEIARRSEAIVGTDVCSLVYTSGTTGEPKGAMLMHGNFVSNALSVTPNIPIESGNIELSFLPLSHVFERTLYYLVLSLCGTIAYAESMETVRENMLEVRPHLVASVPRLYEKIQAAVVHKAENAPKMRRTKSHLFHWALDTGRRFAQAKWKGRIPAALSLEYRLAHALVLKKIHAATGGRIKVFASGGAALRADVCDFFLSAGFTLIEGYGLTETSPVITMNPPEHPKVGTVGKTIKAVELRIAEDKEILSRGPHIMLGYFNKFEATQTAIDEEGWFYTGDIGQIDNQGYLSITDRKKELLVLSNGKNVAPTPIEQSIKESPYIEQVVLIGDNRNFVSALVVPSYERIAPWCAANGVELNPETMADDPRLLEFLTEIAVEACMSYSPYERVKKISILPRELNQEAGELTPTLKIKRRVVDKNFEDRIEAIYG